MSRHRKPREKDLTERYLSGGLEDVDLDKDQRYGDRTKHAELDKILRTALLRAGEQSDVEIDTLPIGQVLQVYSLYSEMESGGRTYLCLVRKTLNRKSDSAVLVGDRVRFRDLNLVDDQGRPQAVIEQVLPRETLLTRADSFKGTEQHPIVANAQQMLIVASLREPAVRWGLIDRMIIAAQGGKLVPIVCLNKVDLDTDRPSAIAAEQAEKERRNNDPDQRIRARRQRKDRELAEEEATDQLANNDALQYYQSLGIRTLKTSVPLSIGLDALRDALANHTTVLSGHSGVGKSTLINAIQPQLDLKTGQISGYTGKGRHTTTSARRYPLDFGGAVIDTPGVKLFGLWGVTRENLLEYFPDVVADTAPAWRRESYRRIASSLSE
jgi:ribosome biogenesis GTPase / thiamine phosphate phosphatase